MQTENLTLINAFEETRYKIFKWRYSLSIPNKLYLAIGMACLTGLVAQLSFHLPWNPVPVTGQTFAVLLAGILLGKWWGGISQSLYAVVGFAGLPWFAGATGGLKVLSGASVGYIFGFILAAFFLGHFTDKYIKTRGFLPMLGLMFFANFVLIHGPGLIVLYGWLAMVKGSAPTFYGLLSLGTIPFIIGDTLKIIAAAVIAKGILPKQSYGKETDK